MFKSNLKLSLRNLLKYKVYSIINITGLALGLTCFLIILLYIQFQFSFDKFHENSDGIYLVSRDCGTENQVIKRANIGAPLAPLLLQNFPAVKNADRFTYVYGVAGAAEKQFSERFFFTDPSFFEVFTFPLKAGNPQTALTEPFSVILTPAMAEKYFGTADPLNKILSLKVSFHDQPFEFKVTGVLEPIPENSHIQFDFLASYSSLKSIMSDFWLHDHWDSATLTYLQLQENVDAAEFESQLISFTEQYVDHGAYDWLKLKLLPLKEIYFGSGELNGLPFTRRGSPLITTVLSLLSLFILAIACINFMNLATARSTLRAKEVGLKKVIGVNRRQLIIQFIAESVLVALLALILALVFVEFFLPIFNGFAGVQLSVNYAGNFVYLIMITSTAVIVGIISGSYPALVLSSFKPSKVLKGLQASAGSGLFRKILVVFQFAISITLIIGALIIQKQMNFVKNKDLGFSKEHVVVVPMNDASIHRNYKLLKNELLKDPKILSVTAASQIPGVTSQNGIMVRSEDLEDVVLDIIYVDFDYCKTLEIDVMEGRFFDQQIATDLKQGVLMNHSALKALSWRSGTGKEMELYFKFKDKIEPMYDGRVIGVVRDFNFRELNQLVRPALFKIDPQRFRAIMIKIDGQNLQGAITSIQDTFRRLTQASNVNPYFLDEEIDRAYRSYQQFGRMIYSASLLAIFVACLGLFGLVSFTAERRTKEVGIRKVLGASTSSVVLLLSTDFMKWVLLANLIAWPAAWIAVNKWLQNFAYRISIEWWVFALAGGLALVIALLTVSTQAVKAALANPVESLRYE
ncbi:MAG: ABC transporter permease [bacterium]